MAKPDIIKRVGMVRADWWFLTALVAVLMFSTAAGQFIAVALLVVAGAALLTHRAEVRSWTPIDIAAAVLLAARALAIPLSVDPALSLPSLWKELPFYLMVFAVADVWITGDDKAIVRWLRVGIGASAVAAVVGVARFGGGWDGRASSFTSGYYTLGMYLTMWLAVTAALGRSRAVFPDRRWWWVIVTLQIAGIVFTFDRIHWIAATVVLAAVGAWRERRLLVLAVVGGVVAALLVPSILTRFQAIIHLTGHMADRDILWRAAGELSAVHPLTGWGLRTFGKIFPYRELLADHNVGSWHNETIQVYMESGLLGLAAYAALLGAALFGVSRAMKVHRADEMRGPLAAGVGLALASYVIGGMTGVFIADPIAGTLFKVFLGVIAGLSARVSVASQSSDNML